MPETNGNGEFRGTVKANMQALLKDVEKLKDRIVITEREIIKLKTRGSVYFGILAVLIPLVAVIIQVWYGK